MHTFTGGPKIFRDMAHVRNIRMSIDEPTFFFEDWCRELQRWKTIKHGVVAMKPTQDMPHRMECYLEFKHSVEMKTLKKKVPQAKLWRRNTSAKETILQLTAAEHLEWGARNQQGQRHRDKKLPMSESDSSSDETGSPQASALQAAETAYDVLVSTNLPEDLSKPRPNSKRPCRTFRLPTITWASLFQNM